MPVLTAWAAALGTTKFLNPCLSVAPPVACPAHAVMKCFYISAVCFFKSSTAVACSFSPGGGALPTDGGKYYPGGSTQAKNLKHLAKNIQNACIEKVKEAYRTVLCREADPSGLQQYVLTTPYCVGNVCRYPFTVNCHPSKCLS